MATIDLAKGQHDFSGQLRAMDDSQLLAQQLVQQGAIHAVGFLLTNGCNEDAATQMLGSLRESASAIRAEAMRRGKPELFSEDQTDFH